MEKQQALALPEPSGVSRLSASDVFHAYPVSGRDQLRLAVSAITSESVKHGLPFLYARACLYSRAVSGEPDVRVPQCYEWFSSGCHLKDPSQWIGVSNPVMEAVRLAQEIESSPANPANRTKDSKPCSKAERIRYLRMKNRLHILNSP